MHSRLRTTRCSRSRVSGRGAVTRSDEPGPSAYVGDSLRTRLTTSAAVAILEECAVMRQSRLESMTVAHFSIWGGWLFRSNAAGRTER
jgi:hypothetical protein